MPKTHGAALCLPRRAQHRTCVLHDHPGVYGAPSLRRFVPRCRASALPEAPRNDGYEYDGEGNAIREYVTSESFEDFESCRIEFEFKVFSP